MIFLSKEAKAIHATMKMKYVVNWHGLRKYKGRMDRLWNRAWLQFQNKCSQTRGGKSV